MISSNVSCVVLGRETKRKALEVLYLVTGENAVHRAWRLAHTIEEQERVLGNDKFAAVTAKMDEYYENKLHILRPPKDFDFTLPEGEAYASISLPERESIPESRLEKVADEVPEVAVIGEVDHSDVAALLASIAADDDEEEEAEEPDIDESGDLD